MEDGERTDFVSNGWDVYTELGDGEKIKNRLVRGFGIVAAEQDARNGTEPGGLAYFYYHGDEHNDVSYITGEDGFVKNQYEYDVFGGQTRADEIIRNRYKYNGEQYDEVTEQYYLRARFYNPVVARFMQEDIYRGDGLNLYAYCGNNAVGYEDPSGYGKKCSTHSDADEFDIVKYGDKTVGLENHHGIMDVWAKHNIPGYKSRAYDSTTIALTGGKEGQHAATKKVYREWLYEKTGKKVGGKINWEDISPREIQSLSEKMFDAASVPETSRREYYREFNKYIYNL